MSVIDEILAHNEAYADRFDKGHLPMPPAKKLAAVVCTGIKPHFAMESFSDLEADVRQSLKRLMASPFIPHKEEVRGFVYDVSSGHLREVT